MTIEELREIDDEILNKGVECPYAPYSPACRADEEWEAEYYRFCRSHLERFTAEDWVMVAATPDLNCLNSYITEYAGKLDLGQLSSIDLIILLTAAPELAEKCRLETLDASSWENLIENQGKVFDDPKYSIYPEWVKADKTRALEIYEMKC